MEKVLFVSFPRSGHHMVMNILTKYFSRNLNFEDVSGEETREKCKTIIQAGELSYCEYYNHCMAVPCPMQALIQKNHDNKLNLEIDFNGKYIVMYRDAVDSIISHYVYYLKTSPDFLEKGEKGFRTFAIDRALMWNRFMCKWASSSFFPERLVIKYDDFLLCPRLMIIAVLKFLRIENEIDFNVLNKSIDRVKVKRRSRIENFEYYDKSFFQELDLIAQSEFSKKGIERVK